MPSRCCALDISSAFVDVAVRRWERAMGRSAALDGDGRTSKEVAAERQCGEEVSS